MSVSRKESVMGKFYAGIGSRETPDAVQRQMKAIAARLSELGWTLRSGGANGADKAFEQGAGEAKEIFIPWPGFNGSTSTLVGGNDPEYRELTSKLHPNWAACNEKARQFHTRNVAQVLGEPGSVDYSSMVICWTPRGEGGGGTGQAIRIAKAYNIPVFDLFHGMHALGEFMKGLAS